MTGPISRRTHRGGVAVAFAAAFALALANTAAESVSAPEAGPETGTEGGQWRVYGGDKAGTKYSPLAQIDRSNFATLELAWRWRSVDAFLSVSTADGGEWWSSRDEVVAALEVASPGLYRTSNTPNYANFQATPLMVDGVLYFNTPLSQGVALDAATGLPRWVYNPKSYEEGTTSMTVTWRQRGVAYWRGEISGETVERIFWGTGSGDLICVTAATGYPCQGFGENGRIDLTQNIPRLKRGDRDYLNALLYSVQSPPIVVGDVVVHGSSIADRRINKEAVPGWVRAWDARTGEHRWDFHTVPQAGEEGVETWENGSWRYSGNANVWTYLSADEELGLVYLPTGTPTNDYYGGHRLGDNLFAESIVAVEAATGKKAWHFQAVHHGLWDYDFPTAPNLLDITVDGRSIKALAQVSKQGFVYTLDRATGEPVWPIEERPVPTDTNFPNERPSPTQPYPTRPAPFEYQGVTEEDLVDFTPEIRQMALEAVRGFRLGPLFTPQMRAVGNMRGTLFRPTGSGAANWSGAAVDPETGILYVPSRNSAGVIGFYEPDGGSLDFTHGMPETVRLSGTVQRPYPEMPQGLPLLKPPYSRMTAIDMNTGEHLWMTPLGEGNRIRHHPLLKPLNLPPVGGDGRGGPLLTRTLLVTALSAGGTGDGPRLVAYDKRTGSELGSVDLPRGAIGTPMTYELDGRQYIALTIGGEPPELIAFTLPVAQEMPRSGNAAAALAAAAIERGQQVYARQCAACHATAFEADGDGSTDADRGGGEGAAPVLGGAAFRDRWSASAATDLFTTIRQTMPVAAPNSLSEQDYRAVTAWLLQTDEPARGEQR